jgi:hypothetical protein
MLTRSESADENRDRPAYGGAPMRSFIYPNFSRWWTPRHDELMKRLIFKWHWHWYIALTEAAFSMTPPFEKETIALFHEDDKRNPGTWYNNLTKFAQYRAASLGLTTQIRKPQWKTCPICAKTFVEDSLGYPLTKRLGMDHLDFCAPCLRKILYQGTGSSSSSREQVLQYLRDLTSVLQQIPHQAFGEIIGDFDDMDSNQRLAVLQVLQKKPSVRRVKELFGSWFQALIEAGVLEEDARRTSRGTQCVAKDGHMCFSLGEKTIDDILHVGGVAHEREPKYPEGNLRADFAVGSALIEYFGLQGDPDYDEKTEHKQEICKKHGVDLISIFPHDLVSVQKLQTKLGIRRVLETIT